MDLEARKRRILKRGPLAAAASPASQQALADASSILRISKGRVLFPQGDAATAVALVGLGRVRLVRAAKEGKGLLVGYRGAGDLIGEAVLGGATTHRESAIATEDVDALVIPVGAMRTVMASDAGFSAALVSVLLDRQSDTEERLASMLFRNVEARLCEFLLKAATRWGIPDPRGVLIAAPFTHQEMASMIGSTRETVTITIGELRKLSILEIDRRRIVLLDKEALRART